jgi:hypothetical protein
MIEAFQPFVRFVPRLVPSLGLQTSTRGRKSVALTG